MRTVLLLLATSLLPFVWGWGSYWLLARLWPSSWQAGEAGSSAEDAKYPADYQI